MATALRGHIHWHDYGPVIGAELSGNRPALIISNSLLNHRLTTAITVPTSRTEPHQRFQRQHVWLNESESYASARQIKSVFQDNLGDFIGQASSEELQQITNSITELLARGQSPHHTENPQELQLIQQGTILHNPEPTEHDEENNGLLVLNYNAGNHMAIVADLDYRAIGTRSPVAVPVKVYGNNRPASALINRIQSIDMSQCAFTMAATADIEDTQQAIARLIQMIEA